MKKIKKLKDYLEMIFENGKIPKGYSCSDIYTTYYSLQEIYQRGVSEVVCENVKNIFEKFGFTIVNHGIGWIISK